MIACLESLEATSLLRGPESYLQFQHVRRNARFQLLCSGASRPRSHCQGYLSPCWPTPAQSMPMPKSNRPSTGTDLEAALISLEHVEIIEDSPSGVSSCHLNQLALALQILKGNADRYWSSFWAFGMSFHCAFTRNCVIGGANIEDGDRGSREKPRLCHPFTAPKVIRSSLQGKALQSLESEEAVGRELLSVHNLRQSRPATESRRLTANASLLVKSVKVTGPCDTLRE